MDLLLPAKKAKHAAWVGSIKVRKFLANKSYALYDRVLPYSYDPERYPLDFLELRTLEAVDGPSGDAPKIMWAVWTGSNEMSENRQSGVDSIRVVNGDFEIRLVTEKNLDQYVLPHAPIHTSYRYLSYVHRSDYLRAYLMYHYGGAYTDIKRHLQPWMPALEELNRDPNAWIVGYPIPSVAEATSIRGRLGRDVHWHYASLVGAAAFIFRPGSSLAYEWITEIHRRLDYYSSSLAAFPGDTYGENYGYPVPWTALGSQILEPLCLKYLSHVRQDIRVKPSLVNHR